VTNNTRRLLAFPPFVPQVSAALHLFDKRTLIEEIDMAGDNSKRTNQT